MIGVHQINITQQESCYFVKRPFGNLLLFSDHLNEISKNEHDLFKSFGGISKNILESTQSINDTHRLIFRKYGANIVCDTIIKHFDKGAKVERLMDLVEPQIEFIFTQHYKFIILKQDPKKIMFVGKDILLKSDRILCQKKDITDQLIQIQEEKNVDLIYFTRHHGHSAISFKKKSLFSKLKNLAFPF